MKTRNFALCALGLAAAITFGGAATASAQARSQTRIKVRKDQPRDTVVAAPKVDTIRIVRVDTVTLRGRVDTVTIRMRPDTVVQMQVLPLQRLPGLYFGLGAGGAVPFKGFRHANHDGPDLNAQVGWFPQNGALGIRFDGEGAFFSKRKTDCPLCPDVKHYAGEGDIVLRFPLERTSHINPVLYFFGGGGIDKWSGFIPFRDGGNVVTAGKETYLSYPPIPLTATQVPDKDWFWHWDAGFGLDFNAGPAHMFVESKFLSVNTTGGNSQFIPIVAGFKFY
jgi:hypothetical protein